MSFFKTPSSCLRRHISLRRTFTTTSPSWLTPNPTHSIYVSKATNPYFNLTLEDWLFRHKHAEEPLLLIYRDDPCVVIGRNQNPWKEVNIAASRSRNIPFIRRRSGGGTVYHDLGNTNFSIHLPRKSFDRHETSKIVLRAVRSLGIDARVNERNDISYKIVNSRAYHHGTMLISTQLDTLGDLLRTSKDTMVTRGVASVRSPVCNLQQYKADVSHDAFTQAVVDQFRGEYGIQDEVCYVDESEQFTHVDYISKGLAELPSWDWLYGQTPEFTYTVQQSFSWGIITVHLRSSHGIIRSCSLELSESRLSHDERQLLASLLRGLEGQKYGFVDLGWGRSEGQQPVTDVVAWLRNVMEN